MHIFIFNNISQVVKLPCAMKTVAIDDDKRNKEGYKSKRVPFGIRKMPFQIQIK